MAMNKITDIQNQNIDYVVSSDSGCLMNINGTIKKGLGIKSIQLYNFLYKRLQGIGLW